MDRSQREPLAGKLPITLITGYLGSGKTTLLAHLLKHEGMSRAAVVINEIGEIGIDHDLVEVSSENITLLANGCICCTVRTDLQETLRELFGKRRAGQIPDFDRVIVETTGLADPAPVVQTLVSDTMLSAHYRLDGIVTLVDALNGAAQIATQPEAQKQVALADRVLITKIDLVDSKQVEDLMERVASINQSATIRKVLNGEIDPSEVTGIGLTSSRAGLHTLRFLGEAGADGGGSLVFPRQPAGGHLSNIQTLSMRFDKPFSWAAFSAAMELLTSMRGVDLLRVKGIVNVDGQPIVVQCVQHIFHPPIKMDRWPSDDTESRLVFITRDIPERVIRSLFNAVSDVDARGDSD
jgi:G3E family GTPase